MLTNLKPFGDWFCIHTDKKCWKVCWVTEVMHKVITVREEKTVAVYDAHGMVSMRQMDFPQFSELGVLTICSFNNSIKLNCVTFSASWCRHPVIKMVIKNTTLRSDMWARLSVKQSGRVASIKNEKSKWQYWSDQF